MDAVVWLIPKINHYELPEYFLLMQATGNFKWKEYLVTEHTPVHYGISIYNKVICSEIHSDSSDFFKIKIQNRKKQSIKINSKYTVYAVVRIT